MAKIIIFPNSNTALKGRLLKKSHQVKIGLSPYPPCLYPLQKLYWQYFGHPLSGFLQLTALSNCLGQCTTGIRREYMLGGFFYYISVY